MYLQEALKATGKAHRKDWTERKCVYKVGAYFEVENRSGVKESYSATILIDDNWQPYHEAKEIRPEKAGELWEKRECFYHTSGSQSYGGLTLHNDVGTIDMRNVIHGQDGWTREFSKVEAKEAP